MLVSVLMMIMVRVAFVVAVAVFRVFVVVVVFLRVIAVLRVHVLVFLVVVVVVFLRVVITVLGVHVIVALVIAGLTVHMLIVLGMVVLVFVIGVVGHVLRSRMVVVDGAFFVSVVVRMRVRVRRRERFLLESLDFGSERRNVATDRDLLGSRQLTENLLDGVGYGLDHVEIYLLQCKNKQELGGTISVNTPFVVNFKADNNSAITCYKTLVK